MKNTKNWYTIDALGAIFTIFTILLQYFYNTFTIILQYLYNTFTIPISQNISKYIIDIVGNADIVVGNVDIVVGNVNFVVGNVDIVDCWLSKQSGTRLSSIEAISKKLINE